MITGSILPTASTSGDLQPDRVKLLMELVGRCLFRYQRIELGLKLLLPHVASPGSDPPSHPPNWREFLDARHTLGPLIQRLKEGVSSENPDEVAAYFESIVDDRNDLVHHFLESSGALAESPEALERAIREVKRRLESAAPVERAVVEIANRLAQRPAPP